MKLTSTEDMHQATKVSQQTDFNVLSTEWQKNNPGDDCEWLDDGTIIIYDCENSIVGFIKIEGEI